MCSEKELNFLEAGGRGGEILKYDCFISLKFVSSRNISFWYQFSRSENDRCLYCYFALLLLVLSFPLK